VLVLTIASWLWNRCPAELVALAAERPNILFIFCDDHAYQAVSAYQSVSAYHLPLNKTPNIDRIARQGMRFDNCVVTNSSRQDDDGL